MNVLRALRYRPFALLWSGQTISRLGDNLYHIALAWWVLEETGSAVAMGTVFVLGQVPMLIFLLVGGVVVDRLPRIRIMFGSDLLNGAVVAIIAALAWFDLLQIWHVYVGSIVFGFVEAFFFPAFAAVVPQITPAGLLTSANSLTGLSQRLTGIVGPVIGASLVAVGGTSLALGLDALSFLVSALFVLPILRATVEENAEPDAAEKAARSSTVRDLLGQGFADLRQGWHAVFAVPWIWISIAFYGFVNITEASPRAVAMPFLIKDDLGADVGLYGLLGSADSLGFALGAIVLGQFARLRRRGWLLYGSTVVAGAILLPFAWKLAVPVLIAGMFVHGVCFAVGGLIWTHSLQEMVPPKLLGRVSSIDALGSFVLLPIGFAAAGWATELLGAPTVFLIGGFGTMMLAVLPLLHPAIRNLD